MRDTIELLLVQAKEQKRLCSLKASEAALRMKHKEEKGEPYQDDYVEWSHWTHEEIFLEGSMNALSNVLNKI